MDYPQFLEEQFLGETFQAWLRFAAILLFGLFLRRMVSGPLSKFICRVTLSKNQPRLPHLVLRVRQPLSGLVLLFCCFIAFHQLVHIPGIVLWKFVNAKAIARQIVLGNVVDHVIRLLLIVYAAITLSRVGDLVYHGLMAKGEDEEEESWLQLLPYFHKAFHFLVWLIGIFIILGSVLHMNIPALIASLGIGGVAIALGAKETVENTLASFIIMVDKPFRVGETIQVGQVIGTVERIGFRSSRIRLASQTLLIVPNKKLVDENLENLSERGKQNITAHFALQYGTSVGQIQEVIRQIELFFQQQPEIMEPVNIYLQSFAENALQIKVSYFIAHPLPAHQVNKITEMVNLEVYNLAKLHAGGFAVPAQLSMVTTTSDE